MFTILIYLYLLVILRFGRSFNLKFAILKL